MTGEPERWIIIPRWDGPTGFQHYRDRDPKWIKVYTRLMSDDAYIGLTGNRRAILHGLWLEYAMSNRCLALDIKMIGRRLALNVKMADIEALNHAGFITISASKPLAPRYQDASLEVEKEKKRSSRGEAGHAIEAMILNGVIKDQVDLTAELRAHNLNGQTEQHLRALLPPSDH